MTKVALSHLLPGSAGSVPILAASCSRLLAHRELASLAAEGDGRDCSQPREPLVAAWNHRKDLVALALTEFIDSARRRPGETVCSGFRHLRLASSRRCCPPGRVCCPTAVVYLLGSTSARADDTGPGLFKSQKRAKQEANSRQRLGIEDAHLLGDVRDAQKIEHSQQKTV